MKDYIDGFLILLATYQFLGWIFGAIYFSDDEKLTVWDWIFFVPGASIGIMSFLILPLIAVLGTIPVLRDPNPFSLTLLGFGYYSCFCTYVLMNKENKRI